MRRFPNEIAVQSMFAKVCAQYKEMTAEGKPYVPMTNQEIDAMMEKVIGPKPAGEPDRLL